MTGSRAQTAYAQSGYAHDDAKLAALEQRVYGLERGVHDLNQLFTGRIGDVSAQLSGLATKLDERSRTPWGTIVSAMGVVLAIVIAGGQLAKAPIDDALRRLERDQIRLDEAAKTADDKTHAALSVLPSRAELEERRRAADKDAEGLQRQIDALSVSARCAKDGG